jgi:hypothetical protein
MRSSEATAPSCASRRTQGRHLDPWNRGSAYVEVHWRGNLVVTQQLGSRLLLWRLVSAGGCLGAREEPRDTGTSRRPNPSRVRLRHAALALAAHAVSRTIGSRIALDRRKGRCLATGDCHSKAVLATTRRRTVRRINWHHEPTLKVEPHERIRHAPEQELHRLTRSICQRPTPPPGPSGGRLPFAAQRPASASSPCWIASSSM